MLVNDPCILYDSEVRNSSNTSIAKLHVICRKDWDSATVVQPSVLRPSKKFQKYVSCQNQKADNTSWTRQRLTAFLTEQDFASFKVDRPIAIVVQTLAAQIDCEAAQSAPAKSYQRINAFENRQNVLGTDVLLNVNSGQAIKVESFPVPADACQSKSFGQGQVLQNFMYQVFWKVLKGLHHLIVTLTRFDQRLALGS